MKIFRIALLLSLFAFTFSLDGLHAQSGSLRSLDNLSRWEVGTFGGGSIYFGDLTPARRDYLNEITPHGGLLVRYNLKHNFSLRGSLAVAKLAADDSKYTSPEWRQHRNFSFTTALYEAAVMLEYDLLRTNREITGNRWGAYAFAGLGLAFTDPQRDFSKIDANYFGATDKAVSGLDEDKSNNSGHLGLVAPVGLGISCQLSRRLSVFAEGSVRYGFDDQIDGFSKSVTSNKTDAYSFFSLGMILRLNSRGWWQ